MAQILEILDRKQDYGPTRLDYFTLRDGDEIASEIVIQRDHITPYCLDHTSQRLIFADLPDDVDLSTAPFIYLTQLEQARRLIAVPYSELADLADQVYAPEKLILIHSTGRAGTTLMNQILNEIEGVKSFSEPDIFLNLLPITHHAENRLDYLDLLKHCVKLFTYPYADQTVALKFRGQCIDIADLLHQVVPDAYNLFMYRDLISWTNSWWTLAQKNNRKLTANIEDMRDGLVNFVGHADDLDYLVADDETEIDIYVGMVSRWLYHIERYYRAVEQGIPFFTMRYSDLNTHREVMLKKLFDFLDLPQSQLQSALQGFEKDSQAGTWLTSEGQKSAQQQLTAHQITIIEQLLTKYPRLVKPDELLPNTVLP